MGNILFCVYAGAFIQGSCVCTYVFSMWIITRIISKLDPEHWSFIPLAAVSHSTFHLLRQGTDFFHFAYQLSSFHLACQLHLILLPHICLWLSRVCASMADNKKDNKGKTSTTRSSKDETILIETLVKQKLAGNWGDNNPKKAAWTACEAALAGTGKPGAVPKTLNALKNRWQRVSLLFLKYMCISHILL